MLHLAWRFYKIHQNFFPTLGKLLEKALPLGRTWVACPKSAHLSMISEKIWSFHPLGFLPHWVEGDPPSQLHDSRVPITLGYLDTSFHQNYYSGVLLQFTQWESEAPNLWGLLEKCEGLQEINVLFLGEDPDQCQWVQKLLTHLLQQRSISQLKGQTGLRLWESHKGLWQPSFDLQAFTTPLP